MRPCALGLDHGHRVVELVAAVAAQRAEDVAGHTPWTRSSTGSSHGVTVPSGPRSPIPPAHIARCRSLSTTDLYACRMNWP